jgi:3-keto-5-aminohexanoate cleavage enzyme
MIERGIKPETETFDLGMLDYARHLIQKGYLQLPIYCNTFLGSLGTLAARSANAEIMRQAVPIDTCWAVAGVGRYQRPMVEWAIKAGAHVRVGLEDNLYHHGEKRVFARNAELVEMAVETARAAGRRIATPAEARRLIGL